MKRLALIGFAACGHPAPKSDPVPHAALDAPVPVPDPVSITLDTDPGLSDLALAADGALWTVSERARSAYRLTLDGDTVATLDRFDVTNVPDGNDLEALAIIEDGRFALGTETHGVGSAAVWFASRQDQTIDARGGFDLSAAVPIDDNNGIEGICADDQLVVSAVETVIEEDGARFAPVIVQRTDVARDLLAPEVHRVRLTSATGKLAALDCTMGEQEIQVLAIERHYDVSRLVAFTIPRFGATTVDATVVRDLTELAEGRNFEGVVRLPDGRIALITDNQRATVTGPTELVLLSSP